MTRRFEVLGATGADKERWRERVAGLGAGRRDLHVSPDYLRVYELSYGYCAHLAVYGDNDAYILQALVRRPLNGLPFLAEAGITEEFWDVASVYGYGGPVGSTTDHALAVELCRSLQRELAAWYREGRIASEFTCLHPLLGNHVLLAGCDGIRLRRQKEVVYVDLSGADDALWRGLRKGHKSSVKTARKRGVAVDRIEPSAAHVDLLARLYKDTMDRADADERWYLPGDYLGRCFDQLGAEGSSLFVARDGGEVVTAAIVLHDETTAYYHFAGSAPRARELCANNLIVFEIARWARARGCRQLHLGGGVSDSAADSLFRFKSGFSRARTTLYTHGRVHHEPTYRRLVELKLAHERATGAGERTGDYFPRYRR